jgi:hypothetical protein
MPPRAADGLMKWQRHPNLRNRPKAPAAGRGRLQRQIARAFIAAGSGVVSSSQVYDFTFAQDRHGWRWRHYWSVYRILMEIAEPIGRAPTIGRPWLWRLKPPLE